GTVPALPSAERTARARAAARGPAAAGRALLPRRPRRRGRAARPLGRADRAWQVGLRTGLPAGALPLHPRGRARLPPLLRDDLVRPAVPQVNELYVDGHARMEFPLGVVVEGPKTDSA